MPEQDERSRAAPLVSVIIPAHDEEAGIGRLLTVLTVDGEAAVDAEIIVVGNGCTDRTMEIAGTFAPRVRTIDLPEPSKQRAMRAGDEAAAGAMRVYLDADVELGASDLSALVGVLEHGDVLAAGPRREIDLAGSDRLVRWYYEVWEQLPQVHDGLFARGVIALTAEGAARVRELPPTMSDDLAVSEAFAPSERQIVPSATVVIRGSRTLRDLIRRRIRVTTGNAQADQVGTRGAGSQTSPRILLGMVKAEPRLALKVPVFVAVAVLAKLGARRAIRSGDFTTWLRDDSSRGS